MFRKMKYRMLAYMSRQMISCDEAGYLVSYRQENRLTLRQVWQLRFHLVTCYLCRRYATQIEQLQKVMDHYRECTFHEDCQHHLDEQAAERITLLLAREMNSR